jgi:hypothetical protein
MNPVDPNKAAFDYLNEDGVVPVTFGALGSLKLRQIAREIVKTLDDDGYQEYRRIKYEATSTPDAETRRAAYAYLMERAAKVAVEHYQRFDYGTPV